MLCVGDDDGIWDAHVARVADLNGPASKPRAFGKSLSASMEPSFKYTRDSLLRLPTVPLERAPSVEYTATPTAKAALAKYVQVSRGM